ncbi:MAG: carbon-nitrogen hydrolase family protein [Pseudomonadota bacterium]
MRIAAVQLRSVPGDVAANTERHLLAAATAARESVQLVVFPELSLTGYEPTMADDLALSLDDPQLDRFLRASTDLGLILAIGIPMRADGKPTITQAFFQPADEPLIYSKQHLHDDELPFFQTGKPPIYLEHGAERLVPAICYEALLPEHIEQSAGLGATTYLASVAKPAEAVERAHADFPDVARRHGFSIVMCNAVGPSDNFNSAGGSAVWNKDGACLAMASETEECLLCFDTVNGASWMVRLRNESLESAI